VRPMRRCQQRRPKQGQGTRIVIKYQPWMSDVVRRTLPLQRSTRKHPLNQRRHQNPDPSTRRSTPPHPSAAVTSPPPSNVPINATAVASTPSPRARPAARALTPARRRQPPQRRHHVLHRHSAGADVARRPSPPQRCRSADCRAGWRSCAAPRLAAAAHQPLTRHSPYIHSAGTLRRWGTLAQLPLTSRGD